RLSAPAGRRTDSAPGPDDDDLRHLRRADRAGPSVQEGGVEPDRARHPARRGQPGQARQGSARCLRDQEDLRTRGFTMRVKFWGTRGTRPTPGRKTLRYGGNTTCIEVRDNESNLLIVDSGSGIGELGSTFSPNERLHAHLLITHTHLDRTKGIPFFLPACAR